MSKILVSEASKLMGVSPSLLRLMIQEEKFPKDVAFCVKNKNKYFYYINRNKFIKYIKE